jgi:hypothetical protein
MIAPGAVEDQFTRVRAAFGLKVTVDAPGSGGGLLEVFVNGELRDSEQVGDTVWTYGIA